MKYKGITAIIIIAAIIASSLIYLDVLYFEGLPTRVSYSVQIPQAYNATSFSYASRLPYDEPTIHRESDKLNFPYAINGTTRVGNEYELTVTYYGGEITGLINGTNIEEKASDTLGTITYHIKIAELSNHVQTTFDEGFFVSVGLIIIVITILTLLFMMAYIEFFCFDLETSDSDKQTKRGNQ